LSIDWGSRERATCGRGFGFSGRGTIWAKLAHVLPFLAYDCDVGQHRHVVVSFPKKFKYDSRGSGLQIEACLVGLDYGQNFALGDFVTGLNFPLSKDTALYGLSLTRHNDRSRHDMYFLNCSCKQDLQASLAQ
jgi:hypothetical protein